MRVLYIVGCNEGESKRYRVFNMIEALKERGIQCDWNYEIDEYIYTEEYLNHYQVAVMFRCGWSERMERLIELLKKIQVTVVFDVDDLVFDPDIAETIAMYNDMTEEEKRSYMHGLEMVNRILRMCDYCTASTNYLCSYINKKYKKPCFLIPNGINREQIRIAESLPVYSGRIRYIGYLSGTQTHQKDFLAVASALKKVLDVHPDVYLKIVGFLDVTEYFPGYENRIIQCGFVDWKKLLGETADLYINLAPLDINTPYSHAKSQLKFFEAALCGVPTVCSPTEPYCDVIRSGENGFLAEGEEAWVTAIEKLLTDQKLHQKMVAEAKRTICREFYPEAVAELAATAYEAIDMHNRTGRFPEKTAAKKAKKNGLCISFIIPQPFEGSGGHRNIFRTIKYLSRFGYAMKVYVNPDNHRFKNSFEVENFITQNFFDLEAEVVWWATDITPCDVLIATHWSTAYIVQKNWEKARLKCYFIQDFEPYFYAMGYEYVAAYNTYRMGLYPITSGPWPLKLLQREFGITEGNFFRFPIDRNIYYFQKEKRSNDHLRVAFFARPDMPRRCYHLGVSGLEIVKQIHPEVEILFYGADASKYEQVPFPFTNLGMLPEISQLGDLYRSCDVGICFSTTNPSLVPYEMMACGCPVVDLDFNENVVNYGNENNVTLVGPSAQEIANGVLKLLEDTVYRENVIQNGVKFCEIFPEEEEMVHLIEGFITERLCKCDDMEQAI